METKISSLLFNVQDLNADQLKRSAYVDITITWPGGLKNSWNEGYYDFFRRNGLTNKVVVEFWTEDGGEPPDDDRIKIGDAKAGEDYENVRGTFTFLPSMPPYNRYRPSLVEFEYNSEEWTPFFTGERWEDFRSSLDDKWPESPIRFSRPLDYSGYDPETRTGGGDRYWSSQSQKQSVFIPIIYDDVDEPIEQFRLVFRVRGEEEKHEINIFIFDDDEPAPPVHVNNGGGGRVTPIITPFPSRNGGSTLSPLMLTTSRLSLNEGEAVTYQVRATSSQERNGCEPSHDAHWNHHQSQQTDLQPKHLADLSNRDRECERRRR